MYKPLFGSDKSEYQVARLIVFDNKLVDFKIEYPSVKWDTIADYVSALSDSLPIPKTSWVNRDYYYSVTCDTLEIRAGINPAYLQISELGLDEKIKKRERQVEEEKKQEEERKRKVFKP